MVDEHTRPIELQDDVVPLPSLNGQKSAIGIKLNQPSHARSNDEARALRVGVDSTEEEKDDENEQTYEHIGESRSRSGSRRYAHNFITCTRLVTRIRLDKRIEKRGKPEPNESTARSRFDANVPVLFIIFFCY